MPQTLVVVEFQKLSGIPQDKVQNTFAFAHTPAMDEAGAEAVVDQLNDFYNGAVDQSSDIAGYMAACVKQGPEDTRCIFYDITGHLDGSDHGGPTFDLALNLNAPDTTSLPDELSVCLSFRTGYGTDVEFGAGATRPRARDRGRIYIGPLGGIVLETDDTTKESFVGIDVRNDIATAAGRLKGDATYTWSVWSRADAALKPVIAGFVDDAWDVQRRRGNKATARSTF